VQIRVRLFALFTKYAPKKNAADAFELDMDPSGSVGDVFLKLGIPADYPRIAQVNGQMVGENTCLKEGDVLRIFPPLPGG